MAECSALCNLNIDDKEIKLSVHPEYTSYPMEPCFYCIDLKLTAPSIPLDGGVRAPIDLVTVIDRSGSMEGDKLELVKNVLLFIVSHLKPFDRLGIVMYDSEVEELAPLTKITRTNRTTLNDRIDKIYARGGTNLSEGLFKGMSMMNERKGEKADVASVMLFTDGMANVGLTSTRTIIKAMKIKYGENKSFTINTFGFGSDHSVDMLREFSKTWDGLYYFIETTEQIPGVFTNCLGGILSTVAQNISLRIEACNGAKLKEIISRVPPNLTDENRKGEVPIGDIQAEEERDAMVEFHLPKMKKSSSYTSISPIYAKISVIYLNVIKKKLSTVSTEVSVLRSLTPASRTTSLKVDEQRNRIKATQVLNKAAEIADRGGLEEARNVIINTQIEINNSSSIKSKTVTGITDGLSSALKGLSNEDVYRRSGRSKLATLNDSNSCQRQTSLNFCSYSTSSRSQTNSHYKDHLSRTVSEPFHRDPFDSNLDQRHSSSNSYRISAITWAGDSYIKKRPQVVRAQSFTVHPSERINPFPQFPKTFEQIETELNRCIPNNQESIDKLDSGNSTSATRTNFLSLQGSTSFNSEYELNERKTTLVDIPKSMTPSQIDAKSTKLLTVSKSLNAVNFDSNKKERRHSFRIFSRYKSNSKEAKK